MRAPIFALRFIAIISLSAPLAAAATWVMVNRMDDGKTVEIDITSIKKGYLANYRTAWVRWTYATPNKDGVKDSKDQVQIDCVAETLGEVAFYGYGPSGAIISSKVTGPVAATMNPQAPDTVGQLIVAKACAIGL